MNSWALQVGRNPNPKEAKAVIDNLIEEEILYREALRLGLDANDQIIKRRLAQKLMFLKQESRGEKISDEELEDFYVQNKEKYLIPKQYDFTHIFFAKDNDGAQRAKIGFNEIKKSENLKGDVFFLGKNFTNKSAMELRNDFGKDFSMAFETIEQNIWSKPITSTYGSHLIKIISIKDDGVDTDAIAHSLGTLGTHQFTGSFTGSFKGDVDIDLLDLTAGNGLVSSTGNPYDGNANTTFSVQADSTTGGSVKPVTVGSNGVGFDIRLVTGSGIGITGDKLVAAVDGTTVNVTSDTISVLKVPNALTVDNSTIQLNTGTTYDGSAARTISVKDGGITNAKLANDGLMLGTTDISLGATGSTVAGLTLTGAVGSGSFSGSFFGDGSGLTGIGGTLTVDGDSGAENVTLTTDDLQIITADANEIVTAVTKVGTDVKVAIGLPDDVVIGQDLTVTRDLTVNRDLTVAGTASFQHTENLEVKDRFVRFASGSNAAGDGGFVVQQASNGTGDVFGFDGNSTSRWGVAQNFDGSESVFTPAAFMASVIVGSGTDPDATAARYDQKGNIFIGTDENIYIYS